MGIVKDDDNGALIIYRGVFGKKFRNANDVGHDTSYLLTYNTPKHLPLVADMIGMTMQCPIVG